MAYTKLRRNWVAAAMLVAATGVGFELSNLQSRVTGADSPKVAQDRQAVATAESLSHALRYAADTASPSVVKIRAHASAKKVKGTPRGHVSGANPFKGTPFEDMFPGDSDGRNFDSNTQPERDGVGSGVIIDKSGIVLTNNHVVNGFDELVVTLSDGREFKATDIKTDPQTDLAVLRIKTDGDLPAAKLGNSDDLMVGDLVLAIGCPFELDHTVSAGIISGKGRELNDLNRAQFLQTDAAINPGNSGGPLVNVEGEVVGINTAIATNSGGYQGIGFSIPINTAKWVTNQLIHEGKVARGYLGIQLEEITADLAGKLGVKEGEGVLAADVLPGTPAATAGMKDGDIVTSFNGKAVHSPRELRDLVEKTGIGSKATVNVLREGKSMSLDVSVKALPESMALAGPHGHHNNGESAESLTYSADDLGFEVTDLAGDQAKDYDGYRGVLIKDVEQGSAAAKAGLEAGMLIRKVGKTNVKSVEDFANAMKHESAKEGVLFEVRTPNGNRYVVVKQA